MRKILKGVAALLVVIIALSAVSCNNAVTFNSTASQSELSEKVTVADVEKVEKNEVLESKQEGDENFSKELLLINANGIVEESKRAAVEAGVYMPDPIMNGAPAGTYPIQGFILSGSSPADTYGNGMSIVYRLSDGSLFIFDGGSGNVKYMLYKCLKDLSGGGKIKVAAWVMTHSHWDHYGAVYDLLNGVYKYDFESMLKP